MADIIKGEIIEANTIVHGTALSPDRAIAPMVSRIDIHIRPATAADVGFVDRMQKDNGRELGFLPTKAIEGKIARQEVLIAEVPSPCAKVTSPQPSPGVSGEGERVGYCIASDRYFKRDEVGYITQINVMPNYRRSLVAAALLQAQFDRSAYGCRLYSCWCAQDLAANAFWESMGFTAIAFRTGSKTRGKNGKPRIHLFWQKRVRAGDAATAWWYPSQTSGGEMREDRLVFPIPTGTHWRDVLPIVLPGHEKAPVKKQPRKKKLVRPPGPMGGLWFAKDAAVQIVKSPKEEKKVKIDSRLLKLARELRDRWSEQAQKILPSAGKHDVRRMIETSQSPAMAALNSAEGMLLGHQDKLSDAA